MRLRRWTLSCNLCSGAIQRKKEHLKKLGDNESSQRDCQILQLSRSGKSVREIASQVNCGKSTVSRIIQRNRKVEESLFQVSRCPNPKETGRWDNMGQVGQRRKQGRRSCLSVRKERRTSHETTCTYLYEG